MAQTQLNKQATLTAPLESQNQAIIDSAKSGNYSTLIGAAGVPISNLTALEKQSQEQVYNSMAPGAGRDAALAQGKLQEGTDISTALNQLFQGALTSQANLGQAAAGIGLQESGAGLNALGQASTSNQSVMSANEAGKASTMDFLSSIISGGSSMAAAGIKGCWIAEAVYGVDDYRTHTVRAWLNGPFREGVIGNIVMTVYIAIGRQVAWCVRRSAMLRAMFKPLFDKALAQAIKAKGE